MKTKSEHLNYIKNKGNFIFECSVKIFSKEELEILKKYGYWFMGLSNGDLTPFTTDQEKFAMVFMDNSLPESEHEKLWFKYLARKQLELEDPDKFKLDFRFKEQSFYTRDGYYQLHPSRNKSM